MVLVVGEIVKLRDLWSIWKLKQIVRSTISTAQPHQNTYQHYCHLNFPLRGNTTPYGIRAWLQLPQCTFELQKHCFTSLCISLLPNVKTWSKTFNLCFRKQFRAPLLKKKNPSICYLWVSPYCAWCKEKMCSCVSGRKIPKLVSNLPS